MQIKMLQNVTCAHLCTTTLSPDSTSFLAERIEESYAQNWLVDGLPAAEMKEDERTRELFYSAGFGLGQILDDGQKANDDGPKRVAVNNHFDIYLEHHTPDGGIHQRVVGVVVWPRR